MEVILLRDLEGKGFAGDIVRVKRGYANNFLIPRGYALPATEGNVKHVREILRQKRKKLEQERKRLLEVAKKLEGLTLTFEERAGKGGKLFSAITSQRILEKLKEMGFELSKKVLSLKPIKEVGVYTVEVQLHRDLKVRIKIEVKAKEGES